MVLETDAFIHAVQQGLMARADGVAAAAMAAYMKTEMPFYGVTSPDRAALARELFRSAPIHDAATYERTVLALWTLPHREEKYLAIALARAYKDYITPAALPLYERMIREGAWWDFVDELSQHLVGSVLRQFPDETWPVLAAWIRDPDLWIRRSALLCQNRLKTNTDSVRLFEFCSLCLEEREFFIRKAIGWALREFARTDPEAVRTYVRTNRERMSGLSLREATKHKAMQVGDPTGP